MKKKVRLWVILSSVLMLTMLFVITISYILLTKHTVSEVKKRQEQQLVALGHHLSLEPLVIDSLEQNTYSEELQKYTLKVSTIHKLDFIVVFDMDGIRLTHPNSDKIGKHFEGNDEGNALKGEETISISSGTLGETLRVFVPVFYKGKQIGVVSLGRKTTSLTEQIDETKRAYTFFVSLSLVICIFVGSLTAYFLKKQLLDLEPSELARLFEEREAMLTETNDAIIVINLNNQVLLMNKQAGYFVNGDIANKSTVVGQDISQFITEWQRVNLIDKKEQLYQQDGIDYLLSVAPIKVKKQHIGYILFFKNISELTLISEKLDRTREYALALQNQSHEFMNILHVIYGLVDLEAYEELTKYLADILTPDEEFEKRVSILVGNPNIAALLITERNKFVAKKIDLVVDILPESVTGFNQKQEDDFISIYSYINNSLLTLSLPKTIEQRISYRERQISLYYECSLDSEAYQLLQQKTATTYFKHLVRKTTSQYQMTQSNDGWVQIECVIGDDGGTHD